MATSIAQRVFDKSKKSKRYTASEIADWLNNCGGCYRDEYTYPGDFKVVTWTFDDGSSLRSEDGTMAFVD